MEPQYFFLDLYDFKYTFDFCSFIDLDIFGILTLLKKNI